MYMQNKEAIYIYKRPHKWHIGTCDLNIKIIFKKHFLLNELKWTGNSKQREYNDVCWILFCTTDTEILPIQ